MRSNMLRFAPSRFTLSGFPPFITEIFFPGLSAYACFIVITNENELGDGRAETMEGKCKGTI